MDRIPVKSRALFSSVGDSDHESATFVEVDVTHSVDTATFAIFRVHPSNPCQHDVGSGSAGKETADGDPPPTLAISDVQTSLWCICQFCESSHWIWPRPGYVRPICVTSQCIIIVDYGQHSMFIVANSIGLEISLCLYYIYVVYHSSHSDPDTFPMTPPFVQNHNYHLLLSTQVGPQWDCCHCQVSAFHLQSIPSSNFLNY